MDSVNHNTNQRAVSDVSNKNDEQKGSPSTDPIQSREEAIPNDQNQPQPLDQNPRMVANDLDREYDCKYCDKRFSNKQALGGHQNAHKVERTLEKNGRNDFGSSSTPYFLSSNYRSHDLVNRPNYYSWHNLSQQHELTIGCNSRPGIAMPVEPHGPPQPVQGFGHVYPGLSSPPLPRLPQFSGFSSSYNVPNHGLNFRVRNIEEGSSSGVRPVSNHQELSAFAGTFTLGPVGNHDGNNVGRVNGPGDMDVDDSGLDLTLRL